MPYVPISRANMRTGRFGSHPELAAIARPKGAVGGPPAPVAPMVTPVVTDFTLQSIFISAKILADMQFSSYFSAQVSANAIFYLVELLMLTPGAEAVESGVIQLSGCGFRAVLATASGKGQAAANIQSFAARGSLNGTASQWTSEVRGVDSRYMSSALQQLAEPGDVATFDVNALSSLNQAIAEMMTIFATKPLQPEPLYAYVPVAGEYNDVNLAANARFAANEIKSGKSLNQALSDAQTQIENSTYTGTPGLQIVPLTVAEVYRDIAGIDISIDSGSTATGNESPSATAKSSAGNFLNNPIQFAIAGGQ